MVAILTRVLGGVVLWSVGGELDWTTKVVGVSFSKRWCLIYPKRIYNF
jgi:hypothetical protein